MRRKMYGARGRPPFRASGNLDELVLLTQAALSIASTQRRVLERVLRNAAGAPDSVPANVQGLHRDATYEVTVVEHFYQLGQQSFALHDSVAMWERPIPEAKEGRDEKRGKHTSIDIALFNRDSQEEARIEFGTYSKAKLGLDSRKLHRLGDLATTPWVEVRNYLILWRERRSAHTADSLREWRSKCLSDAAAISNHRMEVLLHIVSSVDLFAEDPEPRVADVALFEVLDNSPMSSEVAT